MSTRDKSIMETIFGDYQGVQTALQATNCPSCGTPFAVEMTLWLALQRNGETFYCPNGHRQSFRKSETDKLKEQLAKEAKTRELLETRLRQAKEQAETAEHRRRAAKGQLTKERNRIAKGVCPCCNRFFAELHRHIQDQHPEYTGQEEV